MSFIDQAADDVIDEAAEEERQRLTQAYDSEALGQSYKQIRTNKFSIIDAMANDRDDSPTSGLGAGHL